MKKKVLAFVLVALTCWIVGTGILTISAPPAATDLHKWSVRSSGTILYTSDGGHTWNEHPNPFSGNNSQIFHGVPQLTNGWIGRDWEILHATDGSNTWKPSN